MSYLNIFADKFMKDLKKIQKAEDVEIYIEERKA